MAKPNKNPGFQHPLTRVLMGIGGLAMLVSAVMDLSGSDNDTLSLVVKLVAVLFLCAALGAGLTMNKKLKERQGAQHGQPNQGPPLRP